MKKYSGFLFMLVAGFLLVSPLRAGATIQTVDTTGDSGFYNRMVFTSTGNPVIAHLNFDGSGNSEVRLAICNNAACTAPTLRSIDAGASFLAQIGLGITAGDLPVMSISNGQGMIITRCDDALCSTNTDVVLDASGGGSSSLRITSTGQPVVAYQDTDDMLEIAICDNLACANPSFHSVNEIAYDPKLVLHNNIPVVVYRTAFTDGNLRIAVCSNAACASSTTNPLDTSGKVNLDFDVAVNASGLPFASYWVNSGLDLMMASCSTATCDTGSVTTRIVDGANGFFGGFNSSILIDASGNPLIAYSWNTAGIALKMVRCNEPTCASTATPPDFTMVYWSPDDSFRAGQYPAMLLKNNNPVIAFTRDNDPAPNTHETDLMLAVCDDPRCYDPDFTSTPATGGTVTIKGAGGNTISSCLSVGNRGEDGSGMNVMVESITAPYFVGFPTMPALGILEPGIGLDLTVPYWQDICINIVCTIPQAPGTLVFKTNEDGAPTYNYNLECIEANPLLDLAFEPGSTINLNGPGGVQQTAPISFSNSGDSNSELNLFVANPPGVPAGYSVTGLPAIGIAPSEGVQSFNISCTPPVAAGQLTIRSNETGFPTYTYNLTCNEGDVATPTPTNPATNTPVPATVTPSNTPGSGTATPTNTPVPGTPTPTSTAGTDIPTATATDEPGTNLLLNSGLETDVDGDKVPDNWVAKSVSDDKQKCNKPDKVVANNGECAYAFKGGAGERSQIQQTVELDGITFVSGDSIELGLFIQSKAETTAGKAKMVVKYGDETPRTKIKLSFVTAIDYTELSSTETVGSANVTKIKVKVQNNSPSGKTYVDDVNLYLINGAGSGLIGLPGQ